MSDLAATYPKPPPGWPKEGNTPARLSPEEIATLFESDVHGRFYGHAREHVLRMVWTCRRLMAENEELRKQIGECDP